MKFRFFCPPVLIIVIPLLVFSPSFFNDFQYKWDDQWMLLEQPFITGFSWYDLGLQFLYFYHGQYSPVNTLFYQVIYSLFGLNAAAFHAGCLVFHIINSLLVYSIIRIILRSMKPTWNSFRTDSYAGITALLFAIHPLQVESVAWISASKVVLYALFCLAGIWCYLLYLKSEKGSCYIGTVICYLLAFGSKEQAIIFPLNLVLLDWAMGKYKAFQWNKTIIAKKEVLNKVPFFLLAAGMWYFSLQNNLGNIETEGSYPFLQRAVFGAHSLIQYIFRFIAPVKLYYWYFYPMRIGQELPVSFWFYPLLVAIVLFFVQSLWKKKNYLPLFGFAFFLINLLLALHVIPLPRATITADRYMYLSLIGFALITVWLGDYLLRRLNKNRKIILALSGAIIITFCAQSFIRTTEWKNSETLRQNIEEAIEKRKKAKEAIVNNPLKTNSLENKIDKNTK